MKIKKPKFWDQNYHTLFSIFLFPLSLIYQVLIFFKKLGVSKKSFPVPIICVGNIYLGGTGKTPISIKICKIFKELNRNPVIIKKDYTNQKDEVALVKKYNSIITSKNRVDAINEAIKKEFDLIVLDDGYQDPSIEKNLSIICFNSRQKIGNGYVLPAGPLRESLSSIQNSNIVLINGKKDYEFENQLKKHNPKLNFFYYEYQAESLVNFKNKKLVAFAGIGNPENFFDLLKSSHLNVVQEVSYPDHYSYSEKDFNYLEKLKNKYKAQLITTEKDYLRISSFSRKKFGFVKVKVKMENQENFKENILKFIK